MSEQQEAAFPVVVPTPHEWHHHGGMTLRDYFAAKALNGMLAGGGDYDKPHGATEAYEWADAMLAARAAIAKATGGE